MAALAAMAGKLGLDMDDLNDSDRPPPGPPKDPNEPVLAPVMGKSSVEVIEGSDEIRAEGWWHPKGASEQGQKSDAPVRAPEKLAAEAASAYVETVPFDTFALSDEGKKVVLYFGLPGAKANLGKDAVEASFRTQALEVTARVGSKRYRFHESIIYEHIVPAKGKVKVKSDHVVVTMFKVHAACPWDTISVNRKAVGPVRTSPPDHGRPTVVTASGDAA